MGAIIVWEWVFLPNLVGTSGLPVTPESPTQSPGVTVRRKGWVHDRISRGEEAKAPRGQNSLGYLEITKNYNRSSLSGREPGVKIMT